MADFMINQSLRFVDRKGWGADRSLPRLGGKVAREARTHVIIHHTVTPENDSSPNVWDDDASVFKLMRRLQVIRPDLGLDVPYNFVAFVRSGSLMICEGRGEDRSGAHTKGHNTKGIAVSFAGDFENGEVASGALDQQMEALSNFLTWLKTDASHPDYGQFKPMKNLGSLRPGSRQVFAHSDFKSTACPGKQVRKVLAGVSF